MRTCLAPTCTPPNWTTVSGKARGSTTFALPTRCAWPPIVGSRRCKENTMPLQAPQHSQCPATLHHGRINAEDGERFGVVSTDGRRYWLKPAAGCLLRPALGDA